MSGDNLQISEHVMSYVRRGYLPPERPQLWDDPAVLAKLHEVIQPDTCIYVIGMQESRHVKIGFAKNAEYRLKELQCGNPEELVLRASVPALPKLERELHARYAEHRMKGEWFRYGPWVEHLVGAMAAGSDSEDHFRTVLGM